MAWLSSRRQGTRPRVAAGAVMLMTALAACGAEAPGPSEAAGRGTAVTTSSGVYGTPPTTSGASRPSAPLPGAFGVATGLGSVWVTSGTDQAVVRLDAGGRVTGRVRISKPGSATGEVYLVAVGEGAVWATNSAENAVYRIDPSSLAVRARIPVGPDPWGIAVGEGRVWVAIHHGQRSGALERINPKTNRVDGRVPLGPPRQGPGHVVVDTGGVWVAVDGDNQVVRVDPRTLHVTDRITVPGACGSIAAGPSAVWVSGRICGHGITAIDPHSRQHRPMVEVPGGLTLGVAVDAHAVWVATRNGVNGALVRLDPTTNTIAGTTAFDHPVAGVAVGYGFVWGAGGDRVVWLPSD